MAAFATAVLVAASCASGQDSDSANVATADASTTPDVPPSDDAATGDNGDAGADSDSDTGGTTNDDDDDDAAGDASSNAAASDTPEPVTPAPSNSGTVYLTLSDKTVAAVSDDGTTVEQFSGASTADGLAGDLVVAPAGTSNHGTVYASLPGSILVIAPDGTEEVIDGPSSAMSTMLVAPAGTPNAGTIYGRTYRDGMWSMTPDGNVTYLRAAEEARDATIAPAGIPNAGTLYVSHTSSELSVIKPGASTEFMYASLPSVVGVAPAGAPNAGSVYATVDQLTSDLGLVLELQPDETIFRHDVFGYPAGMTIAPEGTPNAGTVYVVHSFEASRNIATDGVGLGFLTVLTPDGITSKVDVGAYPIFAAVAPAGTPNAGTVYVANSGDGTVSILTADAAVTTITIGGIPHRVAVAPAGTPNAGTVYVTHYERDGVDGMSLSVIEPDGTVRDDIRLPGPARFLAIAP